MSLWVGSFGCGCECDPPPPPPPPQSYGYYYGYYGQESSRGCTCNLCEGTIGSYEGDAPCYWQIEVTGFADGPDDPPCLSSANCTNNNGTFILSKTGRCTWESPEFTTGIIVPAIYPPVILPSAYCYDEGQGVYVFSLSRPVPGQIDIRLALVEATSGIIQAIWDDTYLATAPALYPCMGGTITLPLSYSYFMNGYSCCCNGGPATIDIVPL